MKHSTFTWNHLNISLPQLATLSQEECKILNMWIRGEITLHGEYKRLGERKVTEISPLYLLLRTAYKSDSLFMIDIPNNTIAREYRHDKSLYIHSTKIEYVLGEYEKRIKVFEELVQPIFINIYLFKIRE